jgi:uncharacterized membrane protein YbhN (UPF0104 family)
MGARVGRGVMAFTSMTVAQVVAGCTFAIPLAFTWTDPPMPVRVLIGAGGIATLALLDRRWLVYALHKIPRTRNESPELVPDQRAILAAWAGALVTLGAMALAYVVMLGSFGPVHDPVLVVSAFVAAWTLGFVAAPIPAGLGIREAVLAGILHDTFPSSVIVAASVYHRLVAVATEGILAAISAHRVRPSRLAAARELVADTDAGGAGE